MRTWFFFSFLVFALPLFGVEPDFKKYDGSAIVIDIENAQEKLFGKRVDEALTPCSTFKIPHSMIALESKVIANSDTILPWNGVIHPYPQWNQNHSMRSAIGVSTVWFYQELAQRIGDERMQKKLQEIGYGNSDISKGVTTFWLGGGSLKISLRQQALFLAKFLRHELPFSKETLESVKEIITLEKGDNFILGGKTGSCEGIGWFIGFIEHGTNKEVFAFNIKGDGADGQEAKKIALAYIKARFF